MNTHLRPTKEWLREKFPHGAWDLDPNNAYAGLWAASTMSFETVLAAWDDGVYAMAAPTALLPFGGLHQCIHWSRARGEAKQKECVFSGFYICARARARCLKLKLTTLCIRVANCGLD